ncbi:hypothetical protein RCF73_05035 [Staphylococcus chromogenes]|uniref:hypothetical protein n=1 Tax=Staphylococcus chromogenes TaxID=46126 RepID=UPI003B00F163
MINRKETRYFLMEIADDGDEYVLQKSYNGNGFVRSSTPLNAYVFNTKEEAKKAVQFQNVLNQMFSSNSKTYYVIENTSRQLFDDQDVEFNPQETSSEVTES